MTDEGAPAEFKPDRLALPRELAPRDGVAFATLLVAGLLLHAGVPLPVAVAVLILSLAAAVAAPLAGVAAIPAALPWVAMPVNVGSASFTTLELAILVAAVATGANLVAETARTRSFAGLLRLTKPWSVSLVGVALAVAGAASLATLVDERYRPESLRAFRWTIVEPLVAFTLFRWAVDRGTRWALVAAFLSASMVAAAVAVVQVGVGRGVVISDGLARATGPYTHPNNLAFLLERAAPLALAIALAWWPGRRWAVAIAALVTVGLVSTLSRGAVAALIVGAGWVVAGSRWRRRWRSALVAAAALVIVLAAFAGERLVDTGGGGATSSRELIWRASVRMIEDHPVTGVGLDQFLHQYNSRYVEPAGWAERYTSHPHNLVLDIWLSLGLGGLAVAAVAAVVIGRILWRGARTRASDPVWLGASAALIAGLVHGLVDNGYFLPDLAVMTWLFIALIEPREGIARGHD